jgi:hypothetical protein
MRIDLRELAEDLVDGGHLVGELGRTEVVVRDLFEVAAAAGHTAVIDVENREAVLSEELVKEKVLATPAVFDGAGSGTTVGIHNEGNALRGAVAGRQKDSAVEGGDLVGSGELERLRARGWCGSAWVSNARRACS